MTIADRAVPVSENSRTLRQIEGESGMLLKSKNAVIYGGSGAIGGALVD